MDLDTVQFLQDAGLIFQHTNHLIYTTMKKTNYSFLRACAACLFLLCAVSSSAEINPKPFVVPELKTWTGAEGVFTPQGRIVVEGNSAELLQVAKAFAADYHEMFGKKLKVATGKRRAGDFVLTLSDDSALGEEGYKLDITDVAVVKAAVPKGVYWATRTLLQISEKQQSRVLPQGSTTDVPEYAWRGFSIDVARKFIPMSYLQKLVKMMAYYKMNTLSVHLNDNGFKQYFQNDWQKTPAAFRLECDTYPGLTARDGSFTKREFIDFQIQAGNSYVEIIPEIDVPAHSLAFTHYKPEIGSKEYGMDHLDLFNPETYKFVDGLFKEYLEGPDPVFRGKRVHIGTDEYSNAKRDVVEKFREFTDHYIRYVEGFGKQAVVWGALTHAKGDAPVKADNVVMYCWYNGYADPAEMKKMGYKLVSIPDGYVYIVPAAGYYYDYLDCKALYEGWTPAHIGDQKFDEGDPSVLGGMFAVWNDHAGNGISTKDVHHRLYPALQTIAAKCWSGSKVTLPYADFDRLRGTLSEAPGVNERALYGAPKSEILVLDELKPKATLAYPEIGYDYTVSFTVEAADEVPGTVLLASDNAVVYLADPVTGRMGFARDGYLNSFRWSLKAGETSHVIIQGTNKMTRLYVNGSLVDELTPETRIAIDGKSKLYYQSTLVFPLEHAGAFKSHITNFKVSNYLK